MIEEVERSLLQEQNEGNPPYTGHYQIAAKGDFNGNGVEDWIMETSGANHQTGNDSFYSFLVTKRSRICHIKDELPHTQLHSPKSHHQLHVSQTQGKVAVQPHAL